MNDPHCSRSFAMRWSFVKSIAPLNASPIDSMSFFTLSIRCTLGLPSFLFPSNLACSALCGIRSMVILSTWRGKKFKTALCHGIDHRVCHARGGRVREGVTVCDKGRGQDHVTSHL